jgi:hypothetical protein
MTFQFNNYATNELSKSPINDIISGLFGGYEKGVNASYLQPNMQEQLQKAKLYNQYYGPNIESQIGLRGAQAGHLGSLTAGQNITNKYLPQSLQSQIDNMQEQIQKAKLYNQYYGRNIESEIEHRGAQAGLLGEQTKTAHLKNEVLPQQLNDQIEQYRLQQAQNQMFNEILKQRLSGGGIQGNNNPHMGISGNPNYQPGQGQPPFMQQSNGQATTPFSQKIQQAMQQSQPQPQQMSGVVQQQQLQPPQITEDDIINKKVFGIDSYKPKAQAYAQQQQEQQKLIFKETQAYKKDAPVLIDQLKDVDYLIQQADKHPEWFGPGYLGYDIHGPSYRARNINDKTYGTVTGKLNKIIARGSQELSSKPLALALKTAIEMKPGFNDTAPNFKGKLESIKETLLRTLHHSNQFYNQYTGGNLVNPKFVKQQLMNAEKAHEPTIEVHFNGHILDIPESEIGKYKGKPGVKIVKK